MNKITENKKYAKEIEKKTLINGEDFMIELDVFDQKQERQVPKDSISKINKKSQSKLQEKNKEIFFLDLLREAGKQQQHQHQFQFQEQQQQCDEDVNKEEQKQEKENQIKPDYWKRKTDYQDLSNLQKTSKVMIIQDDSEEKFTENTNSVIPPKINGQQNYTIQVSKEQKEKQNEKTDQVLRNQRLLAQYQSELQKIKQQKHPKIQIQQNITPKQHKKMPVMIVDAFVQTDDTSDIHGQEILNLILLEQNTVYQLNQLHEKILRLLNNQI
ncbi:unnamed protein product (macronuclear) [Paramecium tetraurelia]|uniref:Uncharacterized protein n=1 Tax=Paramecium tetraurelia TaxID=5888 RepID=A0DTW3_PARTE|nr:uncharacterized protein GSPATT00020163001 [Paramecium tetraurelia]CAK86480.1 unnamed protein product [Paramecium tetraurelia]|eukprot:XP_001453877.1 hypothetical protein (macronuclear) [Paramecium tetraurelia strain d4-2]